MTSFSYNMYYYDVMCEYDAIFMLLFSDATVQIDFIYMWWSPPFGPNHDVNSGNLVDSEQYAHFVLSYSFPNCGNFCA